MCLRSQQPKKPVATNEEPPNSELASPSEGSVDPEAHLPSICLKQVFPKYAKQFNYLRLVDRLANLFIRFLGVKGTMKLGPTGFRTFIRSVRVAPSGLGFGWGGDQPPNWLVQSPCLLMGESVVLHQCPTGGWIDPGTGSRSST